MIILALDPSGSFTHGSGTTGWCIVEEENHEIKKIGNIKAKDYKTREEYFKAHITLLDNEKYDLLVIEKFILYKDKASSFYNQELETSELIGFICGHGEEIEKPIVRQMAQLIKGPLYKHKVLINIANKYIEQLEFKSTKKDRVQFYFKGRRISKHILDSIRHALYYAVSTKQKKDKI